MRRENADAVLIKVNPSIFEFKTVLYCMDLSMACYEDLKIITKRFQVYETSKLKEDWIVDEIFTLGPFRHFRIRVI